MNVVGVCQAQQKKHTLLPLLRRGPSLQGGMNWESYIKLHYFGTTLLALRRILHCLQHSLFEHLFNLYLQYKTLD